MTDLFGRLTLGAFQHDMIQMGGVITMGVAALAVIAMLFYFKRWKWLWQDWLTSLKIKQHRNHR